MIATLFLFVLSASSIIYLKSNSQNGIKAEKNNENLQDAFNAYVNVYNEQIDIANKEEKNNTQTEMSTSNSKEEMGENDKNAFTFVALGEIMMGETKNSYSLAFKDVVETTRDADYTLTSLTTNIIELEKIEEPTISKYIVTKDILKAFNALGVDGVNIASDHMLDFGPKIFTGTKNMLYDAKLDVIGIQDDIIYAESNGIKVAFIGITNEVIGSYSDFVDAGIWVYDNYMVKIRAAIKKARETADTVVVITHLGSENRHTKTDIMLWFYRKLADLGADLVLGNHALGVYPLEVYNGTPIVYSLGYFMHDTDYEIGKEAGIFKFTIDVDGKIESLEFTPTYITEDGVKLYYDYDYNDAIKLMKYVSNEDNLPSDNKLYSTEMSRKSMIVTFK